ncbi:MAG: hypothetical protein D6675_03775 [Gemmatimonadetes bacterium]|nr:MAG: hypothetical protein D6675_03775 [Gemmatimonadota bacterium]
MFNYHEAMRRALAYPGQVKYELDSYDYYFQQELDQTPIPNFHLNKKIHAVYPVFDEKYTLFKRFSEGLFRIFEKVAEERFQEITAGKDDFGFSEFEQRLVKVRPRSGRLIRHLRFDAIYSPSYEKIVILECNPENPGGMWDNDFAVSCMARNMSKLYQGIFAPDGDWSKINYNKQKDMLINSIVDAHQTMFGKPPVTIAIGLFPEDDGHFIAHCQALYMRQKGFNAIVVNPAELRYHEGKVYAPDNTPIDVLFRGFLIFEANNHAHELDQFLAAYENQDLCVVPPMSDALVNSKTLIAEIPTRYRHLLTDEEYALTQEFFPETHVLTPDNYDRFMSDLMNWVIKPGEGYGGFGVLVGRESFDKELPSKADVANGHWVAQRYYPHETIKAPYYHYENGTVSIETINVVIGTLCILGKYTGTLVRGALGNVINTHQGAEILTPFDPDYWVK